MTDNRWLQMIEANPGHSEWYIERFRSMAADGADLHGEARLIDALVQRSARILDAGCGPGRVGGQLARLGHQVVGVDLDPALIDAAEQDHPGPTWVVGDLAELELTGGDGRELFDAIVCAGNVMTFLAPGTRSEVIRRLAEHLVADGRLVVGFGAGRGYDFDEFFHHSREAGLVEHLRLGTWDLRPFTGDSDFLVAVLGRSLSG